ncbi:MAG: AAA family ATPase [Gammaproteobacteria bacterium]|nr:AAA family ATPase [Gammaproteobacteria bacterium]
MNTTDQHKPDYLQILGLSRLPFSPEISEDTFYEDPGCKNCLDLMLHLGRYSELVLFVSGMSGSGKTSLLKQFQVRSGNKVFICKIDVDAVRDKEKLEQLLASEFSFSNEFDPKGGIKKILQGRVEAISRKYSTVVLLVDNVDKLSTPLYPTINEIACITDDQGKALLNIILFGEPQAEVKLNEIFADKLKILKLSPYSLEDTSKYLQYRLDRADYPAQQFSEIFDPVSILNIYKLSNGLPAQINTLAHNKLIEIADKKVPTLAMRNLSHSARWQWFASGFVVVIVASAWYLQKDIRQFFIYMQAEYESVMVVLENEYNAFSKEDVLLKHELEANKNTEAVFANSSEITSTAFARDLGGEDSMLNESVEGSIPKEPAEDSMLREPVEGSKLKELAEGSKPKESAEGSIPKEPAEGPKPKESAEGSKLKEPVVAENELIDSDDQALVSIERIAIEKQTTQLVKEKLPVVKPGAKVDHGVGVDAVFNEVRRENWLLSQDGQKYTLQLYGTNNETDINRVVEQYKKQYKLAGNMAYFRTYKKGGQWFGLTYGVYSDFAGARDAASHLSGRLKNDAWIRKLTRIHSEIRKKGQE